MGLLFGPSILLLPGFILYLVFGGTPHFFLHSLVGWDLALILLLTASYFGWPRSRWDGFLPLALALYALTPDFIYLIGPVHKDWMDVFLFHISLDEIMPYALVVLGFLWLVLAASYIWFRVNQKELGKAV